MRALMMPQNPPFHVKRKHKCLSAHFRWFAKSSVEFSLTGVIESQFGMQDGFLFERSGARIRPSGYGYRMSPCRTKGEEGSSTTNRSVSLGFVSPPGATPALGGGWGWVPQRRPLHPRLLRSVQSSGCRVFLLWEELSLPQSLIQFVTE